MHVDKQDFRLIAELGLDHVRIPIAARRFWSPGQVPISHEFGNLLSMTEQILGENLRIILCIHSTASHPSPSESSVPTLFTEESAVETFCGYWRDISERFSGYGPDQVAYEFLNEPVAPTAADWNRVWLTNYRALRALEPARTVVVGSNSLQLPEKIRDLTPPADDKNVILSFHFYRPMLLTHYQAQWINLEGYDGPIQYPGRPIPRDDFARLEAQATGLDDKLNQPVSKHVLYKAVSDAVEAGCRNGHRVHCGEFGCIDSVPVGSRKQWYQDMTNVFSELQIPWTAWDWKGNFGVLDKHTWTLSGIEKEMGLRTPKRNRLHAPKMPLRRRLRRRFRIIARWLRIVW